MVAMTSHHSDLMHYVDSESTGRQTWFMRLESCRLDLTGICFTEVGDNIQSKSESVPSTGQTDDEDDTLACKSIYESIQSIHSSLERP